MTCFDLAHLSCSILNMPWYVNSFCHIFKSTWSGMFNQKVEWNLFFFSSAVDLNVLMVGESDVKASLNSTSNTSVSKNTRKIRFFTVWLLWNTHLFNLRSSRSGVPWWFGLCDRVFDLISAVQMWRRNPLGRALYFNTHSIDSVWRTRGVMIGGSENCQEKDFYSLQTRHAARQAPNITASLNPNSCSL